MKDESLFSKQWLRGHVISIYLSCLLGMFLLAICSPKWVQIWKGKRSGFSDWNLSIWEHIDFFQNKTKKARGLENPVNYTPVIAFKVGKKGEPEKCGQDMKNIYTSEIIVGIESKSNI